MFQKIAKHRANDASNDVHRPPLDPPGCEDSPGGIQKHWRSDKERQEDFTDPTDARITDHQVGVGDGHR